MKDLKSAVKGFSKIFAIGLSQSIGANIVSSLFSMYARLSFNASVATVGLLVSLNALSSTLVVIPSGVLSDRFDRKPLIIAGVGLSLVGIALLSLASDITMLFEAEILLGSSWPLYGPSIQALVADLAAPSQRGKAVGLYSISSSLGMFLGPLTASFLLLFIDIRGTYFYSFVVTLPALLLSFIIVSNKASSSSNESFFRKAFKSRSIVVTSLTCGPFFFVLQSALTFYPLFALQQFQTDPASIASIISLMYFASTIARFLSVSYVNSLKSEKRLIVAALLVSSSVALMPLIGSLALSAVVMTLIGISHGIIFPMGAMIINSSSGSQERGTANSIFQLMINLNVTLGPILMGLAAEAWGFTALFPILVAASVMGLVSSKFMP